MARGWSQSIYCYPGTSVLINDRCIKNQGRCLSLHLLRPLRTRTRTRSRAGGSGLAALEALLRLRQACCHVGLVPGQSAETSSKVELLLENIEEAAADGHKALVFSQWTSLLDRIELRLTSAGLPFARLDGSTRDRPAVVASFQDEKGPPVMLISLKAGSAGLNLTAVDTSSSWTLGGTRRRRTRRPTATIASVMSGRSSCIGWSR